jgi:hypothetical protein
VIKDFSPEDSDRALIYLNLAQQLQLLNKDSANEIKIRLLKKTAEKVSQGLAAGTPEAESTALQAFAVLKATNSPVVASEVKAITSGTYQVIAVSDTTLELAQRFRKQLLDKGFSSPQVYLTPKRYAVSLGAGPYDEAVELKSKFLAMPPFAPGYLNAAFLQLPKSDWSPVPPDQQSVPSSEGHGGARGGH